MKRHSYNLKKYFSFVLYSLISYILIFAVFLIFSFPLKNRLYDSVQKYFRSYKSSSSGSVIENTFDKSDTSSLNMYEYNNSSLPEIALNESSAISSVIANPSSKHTYIDKSYPSSSYSSKVYNSSVPPQNASTVVSQQNITQSEYIRMPSADQLYFLEQEIFSMINQERTRLGLNTLVNNSVIKGAARIRSTESGEFKHKRPNGQSYHTVFSQVGYGINKNFSSGENIITFSKSTFMSTEKELKSLAKMLFNSWVNSPSHYKNITDPRFKEIGVGFSAKIKQNANGVLNIYIEGVQLFSTGLI